MKSEAMFVVLSLNGAHEKMFRDLAFSLQRL